MKIVNAIKKLEKAGYKATGDRNEYRNGREVVGFLHNPGDDEINGVYVYSGENTADSMTDYFCETWVSSISQALRINAAQAA